MLYIEHKFDTAQQKSSAETDEDEEQESHTPQKVFSYMQKQLNYGVRHHHEILRWMG